MVHMQHAAPNCLPNERNDVSSNLLQMLACVAARLGPQDLNNCLLVNQQLQHAVRAARVSYSLTERQKHMLNNPTHAHLLDQLVKGVTKYMPSELAAVVGVSCAGF